MGKPAFTPGPWYADRKGQVGPRSDADDQSNGMIVPIADVYGDNRHDDARLFAAAPELLEALEILTANVENAWPSLSNLGPLVNARAAIGKAKPDQAALAEEKGGA
ncbi:hypothetical protein [Limoniibacter endophyticus]|uniref:Uncharacterized protein n=1 Tax=Limoniibacter endophyticus TaxID=1565040 RepID=A0A8J3DLR6_9HYPH|nr:hypothetical protein [Limoniibacter endophyticus]GHC61264.1 hypothetical protein GCM10010136_01720 [Limoniibacter endophyticus]